MLFFVCRTGYVAFHMVKRCSKCWREGKAAIGIEPMCKGFADLCLTAWLRRRQEKPQRHGGHGDKIFLFYSPCPPCLCGELMERETGFEPATSTLARLHSTTELFPPKQVRLRSVNIAKSRRSVKVSEGGVFVVIFGPCQCRFTMESAIMANTFCCSGSFLSITARQSDNWNF